MKTKVKLILITFLVMSLSACRVFKPGCGCPKVSALKSPPSTLSQS